MIKRSFRFGLLVGVLAGLGMALLRAFGHRGEPAPEVSPEPRSAPWPRLEHDPAVPASAEERLVRDPDAPAASTPPSPAPAAPVAQPEPVVEPEAAPVTRSAAKKVAPKKAAPARPAAEKKAAAAKRAPATKKAPVAKKAATAKKATAPTKKAATAKRAAPPRAWVEPEGEVCPTSHPVKAKLTSKIFHLPGGLSYARTRPDRCYLDPGAAEADGLRPAKR